MVRSPDRGDLIWMDFHPQAGHEQAGRRPGLVLSPREYNSALGLALVCPVTSRSKGHPFEVPLPPGLSVTGVVLSDQVRSLDWRARRAKRAERAPAEVVDEVLARLAALLS